MNTSQVSSVWMIPLCRLVEQEASSVRTGTVSHCSRSKVCTAWFSRALPPSLSRVPRQSDPV